MAISKNLKFKNSYSLKSLFEAIKDYPFTAGQPTLTKHGPATLITFPALDSHNQVQIMKKCLFAKKTQKFVVRKSEAAGMGNAAKNVALEILTYNLANVRSFIGSTAEKSVALVDITAEELESMNL